MVERCAAKTLDSGNHMLYITGFQAGGGVGMLAMYSGPDTGGAKVFIRSGVSWVANAPTPKYYDGCDPLAVGLDLSQFTMCVFRSDDGLSATPVIGEADTGLNRCAPPQLLNP